MKSIYRHSFSFVIGALLVASLWAQKAEAAVTYWDPTGTTTTSTPNGTWETTSWVSTSAMSASQINWVSGNAAGFSAGTAATGAFTVTINNVENVAGVFNGGLGDSTSTGLTISGGGGLSLPSGAQGFYTASGGTTIIDVPISGAGGVEPESSGSIYLNGTNTYTGGTTLGGSGIVYFTNGNAFGTGSMTIAANSAMVLNQQSYPVVITNAVTAGTYTANFVGNSLGLTFSGPWSLGSAHASIGSGGTGNLVTISGVISGTGSFLKFNPSTLVISGVNTYTGATTNQTGTLEIGGAGQLGSGYYSGAISNGATLQYNSSALQTFAGVINGSGTLVQAGPGTLILTAINTYTGATTVSGGELVVGTGGASASSAVAVNAGELSVSNSPSGGSWTCASLTFAAGAALDFDLGGLSPNASTAPLVVSGAVTFSGTPSVTVEGNFATAGTYPLLSCGSYSGTPPTTAVLSPSGGSGTLNMQGNTLVLTVTAGSEPIHWATSSGVWDIDTTADWIDNNGNPTVYNQPSIPGDTVSFDDLYASDSPVVSVNGTVDPAGIIVSNNVNNYILTGPGTISGGYVGLLKTGSGTLTLLMSNSFTGPTVISNGTVSINMDLNLGAVPGTTVTNSITLAGGTLSANSNVTLNANRGITLTAPSTLDVSNNQQMSYGGIVNGVYTLTKTGAGTLVFSGNHNDFSNVVIDGGILQTGGDTTTANAAANLGHYPSSFNPTNITLNGGTLQGNNGNFAFGANRGILLTAPSILSSLSNDITGYPNPISGSSSLGISNVASQGFVYTKATNTYSGNTTVIQGLFSIQNDGSISNSPQITINAGAGLDVSLVSNQFSLATGQALVASGTGTITNTGTANAAVINGSLTNTVNLGSSPLTFNYTPAGVNGDASHPSLYVIQGVLAFNGNPVTVNNQNAAPLDVGNYVLIQQLSNYFAGTVPTTATVTGAGLVPNTAAALVASGTALLLEVQPTGSYSGSTFSELTPSQSSLYGSNITVSGRITGANGVYPNNGETVTVTIDGNAQNTTVDDSTGDFTLNYDLDSIPASTTPYTITYSYIGNPGLGIGPATDTSTTVTVNKTPLDITAQPQTKVYGQTVPTGAGSALFTASGLENGETVGSVTIAISNSGNAATAGTNSYTITPSAATGGTFNPANYNITYTTNVLKVTPAPLTITATSMSKPYGVATNVGSGSAAFTYSGEQNSQTIGTVTITATSTPVNGLSSNAPVGSYVLTPSAATGGNFQATNYTITYVPGTLTVTPVVLTITANASRAYGNTNPVVLPASDYSGFVNNESPTNSDLAGMLELTTDATTNSPVGVYQLTNNIGTLTSTNYTFNLVNGTLTVTNAPLILTGSNAVTTYGTVPMVGGTIFGVMNGDDITATWSTPDTVMTPAGTYTNYILPTLSDPNDVLSNYFVVTNAGTLVVQPAPLAVGADALTKVYGQTLTLGAGSTQFTNSALENGETIGSVTLSSDGADMTAQVTNTPYALLITNATGGTFNPSNYAITYIPSTLTVTPAPLTVSADNKTQAYGSAVPPFTVSYSGFAPGDSASSGAISGSPALGSGVTAASPIGAYVISNSIGTLMSTNYTFTFVDGTDTVTAAPLTITANNQTKTYGQTLDLGSTNFSASGLENGETIGSVNLSSSGAAASAPVSGSPYVINVSGASGGTFNPTNYSISYVPGSLTVMPATLTVTADNFTRPFGATNPVFTVTYSNFVNGETLGTSDVAGAPLLTTAATTYSPIGVYDITNAIGTLTSTNYTFTLVDGQLTITNAVSTNSLTASANPALPGTPVVFADTLSALAPSMAVPRGEVQFSVNGTALGSAVELTNGVASITNSSLVHGYNTIEADYAGTTNVLGSTNTLVELINTPPVAGPAMYVRQANLPLSIAISSLLTNATDADGDAITLVSVAGASTNGATITTNATTLTYTPPLTNGNVTDSFTYTVADSYGATNTGTVTITIATNSTPVTIMAGPLMNGSITFTFTGTPDYTYIIQSTTNLLPPIMWMSVSTNTADTNGMFTFTDTNVLNQTNLFYRTITP